MSQITFAIDYSSSFRRGVDCPLPPRVTLDVEPANLPTEERELIAARLTQDGIVQSIDAGGRPRTRDTGERRNYSAVYEPIPVTAATANLAGILAAIREENVVIDRVRETERAKTAEQHRQYADAAAAASRLVVADPSLAVYPIRPHSADPLDPGSHGDGHLRGVESGGVYVGVSDLSAEAQDSARLLSAQIVAEIERRKIARTERDAAEAANRQRDRDDWISTHGSARLKRLVAEGIENDKTYESERAKYEAEQLAAALASERPGWYAIDADDLNTDIADVGSRTLALLDAARLVAPAAQLGKLRSSGKYVAYETFRGHTIVWPRE